MNRTLRLSALLAAAATLAACNNSTSVSTGALRAINAVRGANPVDLRIDGALAVGNIALPGSSGYVAVAEGYTDVRLVLTGSGAPVVQSNVPVAAGEGITLVASGILGGTPAPAVIPLLDAGPATGSGLMLLRVVHAAAGSASLDIAATIRLAGSQVAAAPPLLVPYQTGAYFLEVGPGSYNLELIDNATGTPIATYPTGNLGAGTSTTAVITDAPPGSGVPLVITYF